MFCTNCGAKNEGTAKFCTTCGHALRTPDPAQTNGTAASSVHTTQAAAMSSGSKHTPEQLESFRKLGGVLAFIVYAQWVCAIILAIQVVISVIALFEAFKYASYLGALVIIPTLLTVIISVIGIFLALKLSGKIKNKDPGFLRFYETVELVFCGLYVLLMLFSGAGVIRDLIESVIVFALWELYFRKSVRVRVYFGSDEYLKKSLLARFF